MSYMSERCIELLEKLEETTALPFEVVSGVAYPLWESGMLFTEVCDLIGRTVAEHGQKLLATEDGDRGVFEIAEDTAEDTETVANVVEFYICGGLSATEAMVAADLLLMAAAEQRKQAVV